MKRLGEDDINKLLPEGVTLDFTTYKNNKTKARFIHSIHGEWWTLPCNVLNKKSSHPADSLAKQKKTNLERYGDENVMRVQSMKDKIVTTNMERRGFAYPTQSPVVRAKVVKTMVERHGVTHNSQLPTYNESVKATCLDRYGVDNFSKTDDHRATSSTTMTNLWKNKEFRVAQVKRITTMANSPEFIQRMLEVASNGSNGEREVKLFLESNGIVCYKKFINSSLGCFEIDIHVPEKNIAVEYNGEYWHREKARGKRYHIDKTNACKEKGITLIHIWENEWKLKRPVVESYLLSKMGFVIEKLNARSCEIRPISLNDANAFLIKNHLMGRTNQGTLCIGMFHHSNLVSVTIFGRGHRQNNSDVIFLKRYASERGVRVRGGLSRMMAFASRYFSCDIYTFHETRLGLSNTYLSAGFIEDKIYPPDYFYVSKSNKVIPKQARMKSLVGTDDSMTELEHATKDGLYRVYDCGKVRYRYAYKR